MSTLSDQVADAGQFTPVPASLLKHSEDTLPGIGTDNGSPLDSMASSVPSPGQIYKNSLKASQMQKEATDREAAKTMEFIDDQSKQFRDRVKDKEPAPVVVSQPPAQLEDNPLKRFGSFASILGIFGSAFTKKHVVNALNASAAAINAERSGDKEAYEKAYQEWKDHTDMMLKLHESQSKDLHNILEEWSNDPASSSAKLKAWAVANGSAAAKAVSDVASSEELQKLIDTKNKSAAEIKKLRLEADEKEAKAEARKSSISSDLEKLGLADISQASPSQKSAILNKAEAVGSGKTISEGMTPDAVEDSANVYAITGQLPAMGMGGIGDREKVFNRAAEIRRESGISIQDVIAGRAGIKADTVSLNKLTPQYDAITAFEGTAKANMENALRLMNKGAGTEAGPVINRWLQAGRKATGDSDVAAFNSALYTATTEYAKVMSGAVNNQSLTDSARQEAEDKIIQAIDSPAAVRAVYNETMVPDMKNRKNSLTGQIKDIKDRITQAGNAFDKNKKNAANSVPSALSTDLPAEALGQLEEGHNTTFSNGQIWTLENGEPKQVQ